MATPGSWKQTIPPILPTDQVKASVVNRPITALAERTDYLKAVVDGLTSNEFIYVRNVAVSVTSKVGHLVYWDASTNQFDSALAQWDSEILNSDGTLKPSPTAAVIGLLVNKFTETTGSVVLSGYIREFAGIAELFGSASPSAGTYYLSAETAGRVSSSPPPLAIEAVVYDGEGNLWLPTVRYEHSTHDHKRYELDDGMWLTATPAHFPDMTIPAGATYGYDLANAPDEIKEIFTLYPGIAAFTDKATGANIPVALATVNEDNIWWFDASSPDDLYMWLTAPNSHGPGIVRAIKSDTPDVLDITLVNGLATVNKKNFVEETGTEGYTVVKNVTDENVKKTGYVVEKIEIGEGLEIVSSSAPVDGQGVVELGLAEFSGKYIDSSVINLNNALEYTKDDVIYTAFPADRESSMTCSAAVAKWTSGTKKCSIWLWMRGPSVGGAPLPTLSAEVLVFPNPSASPQTVPTVPLTHTITGAATTDNNKYYFMETEEADRFSVTSESQVQYKLSLNNTNDWDYLVLRQGIKIYAE